MPDIELTEQMIDAFNDAYDKGEPHSRAVEAGLKAVLRIASTDDRVAVTLAGTTHQFGPDQARICVVDTNTRSGYPYRYMTIIVALDGAEFPEDPTNHLARIREGG